MYRLGTRQQYFFNASPGDTNMQLKLRTNAFKKWKVYNNCHYSIDLKGIFGYIFITGNKIKELPFHPLPIIFRMRFKATAEIDF